MALKFYYHPLSSFCQKALIALYESGRAFEPDPRRSRRRTIERGAAGAMADRKFPVLRDEEGTRPSPRRRSSSNISTPTTLATAADPDDPDLAWQTRMWDRVYDLYVNVSLQKIVGDRLRPPGAQDAFGVEQARKMLQTVYAMAEKR